MVIFPQIGGKNMPTQKLVSFAKIKATVPLRKILERYDLFDLLKPIGGDIKQLKGPCPFCGTTKKTPFRVNIDRNCWNCFKCGAGGNILDLVARKELKTIPQAAIMIGKWFDIDAEWNGKNVGT